MPFPIKTRINTELFINGTLSLYKGISLIRLQLTCLLKSVGMSIFCNSDGTWSIFCCSGWVGSAIFCFGSEFGNFPQKSQNFNFFPYVFKKISKSTWVKERFASYLLRVKSMLGASWVRSGPTSNL